MVRSDGGAGTAARQGSGRKAERAVSRELEEKISSAPVAPGVYVFRDAASQPIYIGKAKSLRSRLKSYVSHTAGLDARKREMVSTAADVSYIVTASELEALALEANLIKQDRPKYNVVLRDDKNYPYLRIDAGERWPHVEVVRRFRKDGALYFGPYIPASGLHETLSLIRKHFGMRLCKYNLSREMRPCVHYQMGRCPAPCANLVSREEYARAVAEVVNFLKGKNRGMLERLRSQMQALSDRQMYEEAAKVRDRIGAIERIWDSQRVIAPRLGEADVIGYHVRDPDVAFVILFVRNGIMTGAKEFLLRNSSDIEPGELMHSFLEMFYSGPVMPSSRIMVPVLPHDRGNLERWLGGKRGSRVSVGRPVRGLGRDLLGMAESNAGIFMKGQKTVRHETVLRDLRERLGLRALPVRIGAFDVSTIQGTDSVGGYVVWEDGLFQKRDYRVAGIGTRGQGDDFAMMRESVVRILERTKQALPDLIVIDGGKGQLEASLKGIAELDLPFVPEVISIAKDPDRVFAKWLPGPVSLEDSSPSSLLLRSVRDEAHRFVVGRHRKLRQGRLLTSSLEEVAGVGRRRRIALLRHFGSLEAIRAASLDEIASVGGLNRVVARRVKEFLGG